MKPIGNEKKNARIVFLSQSELFSFLLYEPLKFYNSSTSKEACNVLHDNIFFFPFAFANLFFVSWTFAFGSRGNIEINRSKWYLNEGTNTTVIWGSMQKFSTNSVYRCINVLFKTVKDDDFNGDDAWVMGGEDITGETNTFDVFVNEDNDL